MLKNEESIWNHKTFYAINVSMCACVLPELISSQKDLPHGEN